MVLTGDQSLLKHDVVAAWTNAWIGGDEANLTRFPADSEWADVVDELSTMSMWGDRRMVLVQSADEFVTKQRAKLEKYVEKPAKKSVLVLDVGSWNKSTRLAKWTAAHGADVDCSALKGATLQKWVIATAKGRYSRKMERDAAALLIDLVGAEMGSIDQELSKLAAYVGADRSIQAADVKSLVGDWKTKITWTMTDAVRDGDVASALSDLRALLQSGEPAIKLEAGISAVFRKPARAAAFAREEPLKEAMSEAGVPSFAFSDTESYLRRLGRPKAEAILQALVQADFGLKGASPLSDVGQLELLLLRLAGTVSGRTANMTRTGG